MWIVILVLLLLGAQFNLTALVPLQAGDPPPPWWVGGRLLWPFAVQTHTLLPPGDTLIFRKNTPVWKIRSLSTTSLPTWAFRPFNSVVSEPASDRLKFLTQVNAYRAPLPHL